MQTLTSTISQITTNRPAPLLPGFYSMQALSHDDALPSVTQYHRTPKPALRWMKAMAKKKIYDAFLLSSTDTRWDVYNRHGKAIGTHTSIIPPGGVMLEIPTPVQVDNEAYVASAREILGPEVTCLTWAEHHSHASSVGHSNMVFVARQMIMDSDDKDLEHLYLVDSVASGCRVQGWFMNSSKVSPRLMDQYLDRYKWLSQGWPLAKDHHIQVMAYRMATMRPKHVLDILLAAGEYGDLGEHISLVGMRLKQAKPDVLIAFAARMFEGMESDFIIQSPHKLETFDEDVVAQHANRIAALYRETFLK